MLEVYKHTLRETRGALLGWSLGLALFAVLMIAFFPSMEGNAELEDYWDTMPEALKTLFGDAARITSLEGFLDSQLLSFLPLLLAIYAIGKGTHALVGEEEDGSMDLLLAQPVRRDHVLLGKTLAHATNLLLMTVATGIALALGALAVGIDDASPLALVMSAVNALSPTLVLLALATLGSASFHRKRHAVVLTTTYAVANFLWNGLAPLVTALEPTRKATLFHHYNQSKPLSSGFEPWSLLLLAGVTLLLLAAAIRAFDRKDLGI